MGRLVGGLYCYPLLFITMHSRCRKAKVLTKVTQDTQRLWSIQVLAFILSDVESHRQFNLKSVTPSASLRQSCRGT